MLSIVFVLFFFIFFLSHENMSEISFARNNFSEKNDWSVGYYAGNTQFKVNHVWPMGTFYSEYFPKPELCLTISSQDGI